MLDLSSYVPLETVFGRGAPDGRPLGLLTGALVPTDLTAGLRRLQLSTRRAITAEILTSAKTRRRNSEEVSPTGVLRGRREQRGHPAARVCCAAHR
jgi:hypothetical protein